MGCGASTPAEPVMATPAETKTEESDSAEEDCSELDTTFAMMDMFKNICMQGKCNAREMSLQAAQAAKLITEADDVRLFWPTSDADQFDKLVCIAGDPKKPEIVKIDQGLVGKAAKTSLLVTEAQPGTGRAGTDTLDLTEGTRAVVCVPILWTSRRQRRGRAMTRVIGVLEAVRLPDDGEDAAMFSGAQQKGLATLADNIGVLMSKHGYEIQSANYGAEAKDSELLAQLQAFAGKGGGNIKRYKRKLRFAAKMIGMSTPKRDRGALAALVGEETRSAPAAVPTAAVAEPEPSADDRISILEMPAVGVPTMAELKTWGMPVLELGLEQMAYCFQMCLADLGFLSEFKVAPRVAYNFSTLVLQQYNVTPYHNMHHGFMVFQGVFQVLARVRAEAELDDPAAKLSTLEQFALLIAALGHDTGHDGVNNAFHISSGSELAQKYNDQSPLEMMHMYRTFEVIKSGADADMFVGLTTEQKVTSRRLMIGAVLHTDMKMHGATEKMMHDTEEFKDEPEDHEKISNILLHAVDLNNVAVGWDVCYTWAGLVGQEFNNQYTREKSLGLPTSDFMSVPNQTKLAGLQIGYIGYVAKPFYSLVAGLFPSFKDATDHIEDNLAKWKELKAELEAKA